MPLLSMKSCCSSVEKETGVDGAFDRVRAMLQQEKHYSAMNYFFLSHYDIGSGPTSLASAKSNIPQINRTELRADVQCRLKMCQWCYQVVDYFKFNRETVQIGMSYFDRFLSTPQGRPYLQDRSNFQLACITCLYVAIKVHEPIELDMSLLCELSRGSYTVSQISRTEMIILEALQWRLNPPTTTAFVQHIFKLLASSFSHDLKPLMDIALYQAEVSVFDHSIILNNKASAIAIAAVLNALEGIEVSVFSVVKSMRSITGMTSDLISIQDCQKKLMSSINGEPTCSSSPLVRRRSISKIVEMEERSAVALNLQ